MGEAPTTRESSALLGERASKPQDNRSVVRDKLNERRTLIAVRRK